MLRMRYSDHFLSIIHPSICLSVTLVNNNSSNAIEAICPKLDKNVALVGEFKIAKMAALNLKKKRIF